MERPYDKRLLDKEEIIEITNRCTIGGNTDFTNQSQCGHEGYEMGMVFCPECKKIMHTPGRSRGN